jgi:AcrR family transcriptional regulator
MAQRRRRRQRGSISVDEIVNGAFAVAAEVSIDNLSMPQLAKHLDVGVTSIYWYFRKKDELLDAMTDRALQRYEFTVPCIDASNWRASLRDHARTMRRRFLDDPSCATWSSFAATMAQGAARCPTGDRVPRRGAGRGGTDARAGRRNLRRDIGAHSRIGGLGAATEQDAARPWRRIRRRRRLRLHPRQHLGSRRT